MEFVKNAKEAGGWNRVWDEFWQIYKTYAPHEAQKRNIFVDSVYYYSLRMVDVVHEMDILWKIVEDWSIYRYMPGRSGGLAMEEREALLQFSCILRMKIQECLLVTPCCQLAVVEGKQQIAIVNVWWHIFLNYFSALNLHTYLQGVDMVHHKEVFSYEDESNQYNKLLLASMYDPFHAEEFEVDMIKLWNEPTLATCYKVILSFWLTNIPYHGIEKKQRQRLLKAGMELSKITVPSLYFDSMVNHISNNFWVASYAGGNNMAALSGFGDFIEAHMSRYLPEYSSCNNRQRKDEQENKIRIGYISRCFYNQSVSYYMVNRIIHHDKNKFDVYVFALGDRHDEMTELVSKHATHFHQFRMLNNRKEIAQAIAACQLDILIYTEIGMDSFTYTLAGLKLAPIQCALVGHGTTTGLSTIQYYISGDFEPFNAQFHYRENLIRLPNLGAAQYPPPLGSCMASTRKEWNIPEEAILFVSCANGIKFVPERDYIVIEILKRVPDACIALKPYSSYDSGNHLDVRIKNAAIEAGVDNRLFIVPPLKHVGPLLSIADIQLDTYPYGGWTTNMEALYMGLPIITQEGDMGRSRWGAHMLRALGIYEGIASSAEEYIEWAVRLARDKNLRESVKNKIAKNCKSILFDGSSAQEAYEEVLVKIFVENKQ